jgi:hypothetical protein
VDANVYTYVSGRVLVSIDPVGLWPEVAGVDLGKAAGNAVWNVANVTGSAQNFWDAGAAASEGKYGKALLKAGEGVGRNTVALGPVLIYRTGVGMGELGGAVLVSTGAVDAPKPAQVQARQDVVEGAMTMALSAGLAKGAGTKGGGGATPKPKAQVANSSSGVAVLERAVATEQALVGPAGPGVVAMAGGDGDGDGKTEKAEAEPKPAPQPQWTPHGHKHAAPKKAAWNDVVKSTKKGPAKYLPGTNIEALERKVWAEGTSDVTGKNYKVMQFEQEIGASGGESSRWVRVEESGGTIHGHPITQAEFNARSGAK